jgi:hypothetical protein
MVFDELMKWYEEVSDSLNKSKKQLDTCVSNKKYDRILEYNSEIKCFSNELERIKKIIQNNFLSLIENKIPLLEAEYKKQCEFSKGAWEMYGSELAGDYNASEKKIFKKLNLYKDLLK